MIFYLDTFTKRVKEYFSSKQKSDIYLDNDKIYYKDEEVLDIAIMKIKGIHNIENCMCAIGVAKELEVPTDVISKVISAFSHITFILI